MKDVKFRIWESRGQNRFLSTSNGLDFEPSYLLKGNAPVSEFLKRTDDWFVVQSFTGKKDVNKQEIYEGDIVYLKYYDVIEVDTSCLFKVIFDDGAFKLKPIKLGTAPDGGIGDFSWMRYIVGDDSTGTIYRYELPPSSPICGRARMCVIGNIFENPELLK